MKKLPVVLVFTAILMLQSCSSARRKEQTISISGAFALYPLVVQWAELYKKENPEVRFNISAGGAGKGMADALSATVDLGMVSREIAPEEIDKGAWFIGVTIDAVLPTISSNNPFIDELKLKGLTREQFQSVFINNNVSLYWNNFFPSETRAKITVYTRSDACGAADTWAKYLGAKQENLTGIGIFGDPALADAVAQDPSGIGFNNTIFIYDIKTGLKRQGIEVVPVDIDENGTIDSTENFYTSFNDILKAIAEGRYPSPPARELFFVSKGKPGKDATLQFLKWILTEGQKYVKEAGYVPVNQAEITKSLEKLN